jgi:2-polyprenyl-6-hydroxyphenyl methylase/3-demethylubiquinone-9 3-methyltransferase
LPTPPKDPAVAYHDALAAEWGKKYAKDTFSHRYDTFVAALTQLVQPGSRWLDVGCGTGVLSRWLVDCKAVVDGVDASPRMLEQARASAPGVNLQLADAAQLPFGDATFDGIVCSSVIEYLRDPAVAVREAARVLRSNGSYVFSVPNRDSRLRKLLKLSHSVSGQPKWIRYSVHEFDAAGLRSLLKELGFGIDKVVAFGPTIPVLERADGGSLLLISAKKL